MNLYKSLFRPADNSPLILFRILFGFLLGYHFLTFLLDGSVYRDFIKPPFTFTYIGFEFLQPLPGTGMYFYVGAMVLLALMIMTGAWYRMATICFSLMWTALYLMQKSHYNNHYYLMVLLSWIMVFMPANRDFSIDILRKPAIKTTVCSRYCGLIFIAQIAVVFFFAAISKLSADWLSGTFIAIRLSALSHHPVVGIVYRQKWFQLLICYGGFVFDLSIVPLLLWKKTRPYALLFSCLFHLFNSYTFDIGIFPYLCLAFNVFFIDPALLRRLFLKNQYQIAKTKNDLASNEFRNKILISCFGIYFLFQVLIPMRSWLFPGNVFWSEEGYRLSWKMMLRTKTGSIYFKVVDPVSGKKWKIDPAKIFARSHVVWLAISPDIIWQYSQRLKADFSKKGYPNVMVYAIGSVSLNKKKPLPLVDTTVNLAAEKWYLFQHSTWITNGPEK